MPKPFLRAQWRNLLMLNFPCDPALLSKHLPAGVELDTWRGTHYVSLVGFMFLDTRVLGVRWPFHVQFEEFNLRFYVRRKVGGEWRRGVVFHKEIVPRSMISLIANTLYEEHYETRPMRHQQETRPEGLFIQYSFQVGADWNFVQCLAEPMPTPLIAGSEEEFITEHYWGYTRRSDARTGEYEVRHPRWNIHTVQSFDFQIDAERLYGAEWRAVFEQTPTSVFLAEGSAVEVMPGGMMS